MNALRSVRTFTIGAVAIVAIGCGSDSITGASSVEGTYSLRTINGSSLPVTLADSLDGLPLQVTFMSPTTLTLNADHSFRIIATARFVWGSINEVQTDTTRGTFTVSGTQVTFSEPGTTDFTAQWNGSDMLTVNDDGVFVFRK